MQDTGLFLSLAEIAGVFVGFGALIAARSGGSSDPREVAPMRGVVMAGVTTIIAALAPVTLGRYDLTEHQVLALSSVLVLVTYSVLAFYHRRAPEYKAAAATFPTRPGRLGIFENAVENVAIVLVIGGSLLALAVIAVGLVPELEAALYFTAAVLILVQAAWTLLWAVFMERRPASA